MIKANVLREIKGRKETNQEMKNEKIKNEE